MRDVPQSMTDAWLEPDKTGDRRPVVRATIQRTRVGTYTYDTYDWQGGKRERAEDRHAVGYYTSVLFGNPNPVREILNIDNCSWERTLDGDTASCTLEILNSETTPIGAKSFETMDFEQPGFFTATRGADLFARARWGHKENAWKNVFVPDMYVKTYEGYGVDYSVDADNDPHLVQTGVWLIDEVSYTSDAQITMQMRDLGRLLLDHIAFPPIVPQSEYPVEWEPFGDAMVPGRDSVGGTWKRPTGRASSSNQYYVGRGIQNGDHPLVDAAGNAGNDPPSQAIDGNATSRWRAASEAEQINMAWWQVDLSDRTTAMNGIRIRSWATTYIYISLRGKKGWIGRKSIPYERSSHNVDLRADIPFVMRVRAEAGKAFDVSLPRKYGDISAIRLTMQTTRWDGSYRPFPWYGGINDVKIHTAKSVKRLRFRPGRLLKTVGNYRDYSTIPHWVCAWAGFFHPEAATGQNYYMTGGEGEDSKKYVDFRVPGQSLGNTVITPLARGRVWGNMVLTYTKGETTLTADMFDKKPLMDMINYVRDLTGFIFFINEEGHAVFRQPNIWSHANVRTIELGSGTRSDPIRQRFAVVHDSSKFVVVDENETLISYTTVLNSRNIRERIFVGHAEGKIATTIDGYNPVPTGLRRVAGWTDQRFANKRETEVMADMIAARAKFDYRRGRVTMPGYPRVQIDDQIRIIERVTSETYWHYVLGIRSNLSMTEGTWTYDVETHWLGEDPDGDWVISKDELSKETRRQLHAQGIS